MRLTGYLLDGLLPCSPGTLSKHRRWRHASLLTVGACLTLLVHVKAGPALAHGGEAAVERVGAVPQPAQQQVDADDGQRARQAHEQVGAAGRQGGMQGSEE